MGLKGSKQLKQRRAEDADAVVVRVCAEGTPLLRVEGETLYFLECTRAAFVAEALPHFRALPAAVARLGDPYAAATLEAMEARCKEAPPSAAAAEERFCFLASACLEKAFCPTETFYPFSGQWNAYSPFTDLPRGVGKLSFPTLAAASARLLDLKRGQL